MSWDRSSHYIKRSLSEYEKSELLNTGGRALIMPGTPNGLSACEIDELISAGFDLNRIVSVENDGHVANHLHSVYYDRALVIWDELEDFLRFSQSSYCYIHADYMGFLKEQNLVGLQNWIGKVDPFARLRVSLARPRKRSDQKALEEMWFTRFVVPLAKAAAAKDNNSLRWLDISSSFNSSNTTSILVLMMVMNFVFGTTVYDWTDAGGTDLPEVNGTHEVIGVNRFLYKDGSRFAMETAWVDLGPAPPNFNSIDHLWNIYRSLSIPIPQYSPRLYHPSEGAD